MTSDEFFWKKGKKMRLIIYNPGNLFLKNYNAVVMDDKYLIWRGKNNFYNNNNNKYL